MRLVAVSNHLSDAIYQVLDKALEGCPEAAPDREVLYGQLLSFFDEHGYIPEFSLTKREAG